MARYAVIGTPIAQSKSPAIHRMFAEQTKQDMEYEAIEVVADNFDSFVLDFFANGGDGLNVTVPHKERAYRIVNQLEPLAEQAGAVNTLFQSAEGTLCGDNTFDRHAYKNVCGHVHGHVNRRFNAHVHYDECRHWYHQAYA